MTRRDSPEPGPGAQPQPESVGKKYSPREIAQIFGDVLPEQTADDRGDRSSGSASSDGGDAREQWYRENRPPHHGG